MLHPSLRDLWTPDPAGPGHVLTLPQGWMQGRAVFGGLVVAAAAALALRRARERAEGGGPEAPGGAGGGAPQVLRSVSTQLLRPLSPGPVTGVHRVVRAGRAARFDEVRLSQGGDLALTAHVLHVPESFEQWFPFEYETVAGEDGWHTVVGRLHDASGRLLGWTEQLVAVFA